MNGQLNSNSVKDRIDYLEAKCAFLCSRLSEILTKYTDEGRIRIELPPANADPAPQYATSQAYTGAEMIVAGAFHSILGRSPSEDDLDFYAAALSKHGRSRVVRDIFLSVESANANKIPRPLAALARLLWMP